jgi:beta-glucanase (GH16 family)
MRAGRSGWAVGVGGLVAALVAALAPPAAAAAPQPPSGMRLVFSDDFSTSSLNTAKWATCYPWFPQNGSGCTNFGNNELEWYLPTQDQVSGGSLHEVAAQVPTTGRDASGQTKTYSWRSGMITSFPSFSFTYGYVEASARVPKGAGFWPTLWLLPKDETWPPEIDYLENLGSDTTHYSAVLHGISGKQYLKSIATADLSAGYHTFGVDWEPAYVTWYLDGRAVFTYRGSDVPTKPMYLLATLAISGTSPPNSLTPPQASFDIDYLRVYKS